MSNIPPTSAPAGTTPNSLPQPIPPNQSSGGSNSLPSSAGSHHTSTNTHYNNNNNSSYHHKSARRNYNNNNNYGHNNHGGHHHQQNQNYSYPAGYQPYYNAVPVSQPYMQPQGFYSTYGQPIPVQYYPQTGELPPPTVMAQPQPYTMSPPQKHQRLVIKTRDGEEVNFTKGHSKTPSSVGKLSSTTTPVLQKASINPPETTSVSASPSSPLKSEKLPAKPQSTLESSISVTPSSETDKDKQKKNADFKAVFLARINAKKLKAQPPKEKEEPANIEEKSIPVATTNESKPTSDEPVKSVEKKEEPVKVAPALVEIPVEAPKKEQPSVQVAKPVPTEIKKEEATIVAPLPVKDKETVKEDAPTPAPVPTAVKEIVKEDIPILTPSVIEKEEANSPEADSASTDINSISTAASDLNKESTFSEEAPDTEEKEEDLHFTLSDLVKRLDIAKPITSIYTFDYPESAIKPDTKFQESKRTKYDPRFLLQFESVCKFQADEEWIAKFGSKIVIPDTPKKDARDRGYGSSRGGQYRSGAGDRGPERGGLSRTSTLRTGGGDYSARSGSRGGSRKKEGRGGRERSQRQGSKRPRGGERRERTNESRRGHNNDEPAAPPVDVKPLEISANRWVPKSKVKKDKEIQYAPDGTTVLLDSDEVASKCKSLLNKMTLEMFDEISNEMVTMANQSKWEDDAKSLKTVIELTFAKACDEQFWSAMYAKFCLKLCKDIDPEVKLAGQKDVNSPQLVRKMLLTRCQTEYEKGWVDKLPTNEDGSPLEPEMMSDEYYEMAAAKRRGLGLVRFIGELFAIQLLRGGIIRDCILKTVSDDQTPSQDTLETAIQLLMTTGPIIDREQSGAVFLTTQFDKLQKIVDTCKISSRLKFKLMDLIDLRKSGWIDSKTGSTPSGPKTITEIHQEAEQKRLQEEQQSRKLRSDKRSGSSRQSSRWGNNDRISSNDLSKVGVIRNSSEKSLGPFSNKKRFQSQASLNRMTQQSSSANLHHDNDHFTPVSSSTNQRSFSRSNPPATPEKSEPREASVNRFAALGLGSDDDQDQDQEDEDDEENEEEEEEEEKVSKSSETPAPTVETPSTAKVDVAVPTPVKEEQKESSAKIAEEKKKKEMSEEVQKLVEAKLLEQNKSAGEESKRLAAELELDFDMDAD